MEVIWMFIVGLGIWAFVCEIRFWVTMFTNKKIKKRIKELEEKKQTVPAPPVPRDEYYKRNEW